MPSKIKGMLRWRAKCVSDIYKKAIPFSQLSGADKGKRTIDVKKTVLATSLNAEGGGNYFLFCFSQLGPRDCFPHV